MARWQSVHALARKAGDECSIPSRASTTQGEGMATENFKVHKLSLSDANKHRYHALTCIKCKNLILARTDHIKNNEVKDCDHKNYRRVQLQGGNWNFVGR